MNSKYDIDIEVSTNYDKMKSPDNFMEPRIPQELDGVWDQISTAGDWLVSGDVFMEHKFRIKSPIRKEKYTRSIDKWHIAELMHTPLCDVINE